MEVSSAGGEEEEEEDEYDVEAVTVPVTICLAIMVGYVSLVFLSLTRVARRDWIKRLAASLTVRCIIATLR